MPLSNEPALYPSDRAVGQVLEGNDAAAPLVEACAAGKAHNLRTMLAEPRWRAVALAKPHRIYDAMGPAAGRGPKQRNVFAAPKLNAEFLLETACRRKHLAPAQVLLVWAADHSLPLVTPSAVSDTIEGGSVDILAALVGADASAATRGLGLGSQPLTQAIITSNKDLVEFLVAHGADPALVKPAENDGRGYGGSLLSLAARVSTPSVLEVLLTHGAPIPKSGALHTAADRGSLDAMQVLLSHGADVNEKLPAEFIYGRDSSFKSSWTPMHFAAAAKQYEAVTWLQEHGGDPSVMDGKGRSPRDFF